ncbi:DNA-protecting protein DprA [Patescibacteria group bacterium]|nr:DNA-protecting protein DprA [Patescibacteria group bacterium]MCH8888848.1 DNA-protecting protein DprA [Patescibacteria group bacterium]
MKGGIRQLKESDFPELLRQIPDPPERLFIEGPVPSSKSKLLCVVGSRHYSPYGKDVCERLISGLSGYNVTIVSGLAIGMDSIAHRAAISARLDTLAIPGSGLDPSVLYPASHRALARQIVERGGTLLSEFEPNTPAAPFTFPQRNRIMAGISHATLVIEATLKSGTLITARLATDYNRDVLTVPHPIYSKTSRGPHMLLRLGATLIEKSEDILEALHIDLKKSSSLKRSLLSEDERKVIDALYHPLERDVLVKILGMPAREVNVLLTAMEIKGLIAERLGEIHIL